MTFEGALIREQGVEFAIIIVKPFVLNSNIQANQFRNQCSHMFPGVPIILMAQDSRGIPTYQGRTDIVKFLSKVHPNRIPWKKYTI